MQFDEVLKTTRRDFSLAKTEIAELRKNRVAAPESTNPDMNAINAKLQQQQNEIEQFSAQYEQTNRQNEVLTSQVNSLTEENSGLKSELDNLRSAGGADMQSLQTELAEKSARLNEMNQEYTTVKAESERLQRLAENANAENVRLSEQIEGLSSSNQQLEAQLQSNLANVQTIAPPIAPEVETSVAVSAAAETPARFVSSKRSNTADLTAQNQQLLAVNKKTETENELLSQRIVELEGTIDGLSIKNKDTEPSATALNIGSLDTTGSDESKFSIMRWLIPFLGIGLAVALYVFLIEENQIASLTGTDTRRLNKDSRHPRHNEPN